MREYTAEIIIALIGAVPPTIMAAAAWIRAKRLEKPINEVNTAVNHRIPGQKKLIEVIDDMAIGIYDLGSTVNRLEKDIQQHKAWHQEQTELETEEYEDIQTEEE